MFQDFIHLIAKLRVRFNKTQKIIPLGNYVATPAHIHSLMEDFGKDQTGLLPGDLFLEDKMNYDAEFASCRSQSSQVVAGNPREIKWDMFLRRINGQRYIQFYGRYTRSS